MKHQKTFQFMTFLKKLQRTKNHCALRSKKIDGLTRINNKIKFSII